MGGEGSIVEIDETFIGKKEGFEKRRRSAHKNVILSLVQRGGFVRSFMSKAPRNLASCQLSKRTWRRKHT